MNSHTALSLTLAGALVAPAVPAEDCNAKVRRSAPDSRYIVNAAKGTVLDKQTGLTWKRCVEGLSGADCGAGTPADLNWGAALRQAETSTFAGHKDWRIPNSKELESLVEVACYPALNATVFPNAPISAVWASSPIAGKTSIAWCVTFNDGGSTDCLQRVGMRVRLVRGGQ